VLTACANWLGVICLSSCTNETRGCHRDTASLRVERKGRTEISEFVAMDAAYLIVKAALNYCFNESFSLIHWFTNICWESLLGITSVHHYFRVIVWYYLQACLLLHGWMIN